MSLERMDIDFYIDNPLDNDIHFDRPLWELPSEPSIDDFLCPLLDKDNPMDFMSQSSGQDFVRNDTQGERGFSGSVAGPGVPAALPELFETYNESSSGIPAGLTREPCRGEGNIIPAPLQNSLTFSENAPLRTLQDSIPDQVYIVPEALHSQHLQERFNSFSQALPQSHSQQFFEPHASSKQLCPEQHLQQLTETTWNYLNTTNLMSDTPVSRSFIQLETNPTVSLCGSQNFASAAPEAEMLSPELPEFAAYQSALVDQTEIPLSSRQDSFREALSRDHYAKKAKSYNKIPQLYEHKGFQYSKVKIQNPAVCPACDKKFPNVEYLYRHIKRFHNDKHDQALPCPECYQVLGNETNLLRHITKAHNMDKIVENCETCGARFSSQFSATSHRRDVHGIQSATSRRARKEVTEEVFFFKCETCGHFSKEKGNMKRHVNGVHLQQRSFHCECGKEFNTKHNLDCHLASKACSAGPF